jgi:O-antigen ligase
VKARFNRACPGRFGVADSAVVVVAMTLPLLLLRPDHLPLLASGADVDLRPSDVGIVAVVAVAAAGSVRHTSSLLAARRWLWLAPFLALLLGSAATVPDVGRVTVAVMKIIEYAVFGAALTLLLRNRRDIRVLFATLGGCAGALGILGAAELAQERRLGVRAESLIGADPLGLLGAVTLTVALTAPGLVGSRVARFGMVASGLLCVVVSASMSAAVGLLLALGFAAARRLGPFALLRTASLATLAVLTLGLGGVLVAARWSDVDAAFDQVNGSPAHPRPGGSFVQRAMFADFGARIWLDHPVYGVGFQQSRRLEQWGPYLASVRDDFPALSPTYFPTVPGMHFGQPPSNTGFGLHNAYSQLLAETGIVGLLLFLVGVAAIGAAALRRAGQSELACTGGLLVLVVLGGLTRNELFGGLPETTLMVVALALAACGADAADDI